MSEMLQVRSEGASLPPESSIDARRQAVLKRLLTDVGLFSRHVVHRPLRPYQLEPARAIVDSVLRRKGLTFTVLMARQAGKNELSAQLEAHSVSSRVGDFGDC